MNEYITWEKMDEFANSTFDHKAHNALVESYLRKSHQFDEDERDPFYVPGWSDPDEYFPPAGK